MILKKRHGCVTAWLILMLVANLLAAVLYISMRDGFDLPGEVVAILAAISVLNIFFTIMLFLWKRWAFWGFAGTALIIFAINLNIGTGIFMSVLGLVGVAFLYALFQIKEDGNSAWDQLE